MPTPGEVAYETYRTYAGNHFWHHYDRLGTHEKAAWDAAAQAVLDAAQEQKDTP